MDLTGKFTVINRDGDYMVAEIVDSDNEYIVFRLIDGTDVLEKLEHAVGLSMYTTPMLAHKALDTFIEERKSYEERINGRFKD